MKYKCPCCEYYTLLEKPTNTYQICPVCSWEDDGAQFIEAERKGGANVPSLNEAKRNYKSYGACEEGRLDVVRCVKEDEYYGIDWY